MSPFEMRSKFDLRRSGRTTILALEGIANAIRDPGAWHKVVDHTWSKEADNYLFLTVVRMTKEMGLKFEFNKMRRQFRSVNFGLLVAKGTHECREATESERRAFD